MRQRFLELMRRPPARQRLLSFGERAQRHDRLFRLSIVVVTALALAAPLGATSTGRFAVGSLAAQARLFALQQVGLEPERAEIEAELRIRRTRAEEQSRESLENYYRGASGAMQRLFRATGMDPDHGLITSGRVTNAFLLSPQVFSPDSKGRSYRLRPNLRSVWLRQVTLRGGPFGLFLVADTPEVRAAAVEAEAIVDEPSTQTTNSWGLRGPEPNPDAQARGIVLGDSFMQGMFNGDNDTPPLRLENALSETWRMPVSILNTGHIGYAPEQYYYTLEEYGERFHPHFVVVSVCPNDFGNESDVMAGRGDDWDEAKYWLGEISQWCRSHMIPCLLVSVPCEVQIVQLRKDGHYPAPVCDLFQGNGTRYCDPLDQFIDEHLRLVREALQRGETYIASPLYNDPIADNHFSPTGAVLWARVVARRLDLLMTPPEQPDSPPRSTTGR
jgi:hypothetical protein